MSHKLLELPTKEEIPIFVNLLKNSGVQAYLDSINYPPNMRERRSLILVQASEAKRIKIGTDWGRGFYDFKREKFGEEIVIYFKALHMACTSEADVLVTEWVEKSAKTNKELALSVDWYLSHFCLYRVSKMYGIQVGKEYNDFCRRYGKSDFQKYNAMAGGYMFSTSNDPDITIVHTFTERTHRDDECTDLTVAFAIPRDRAIKIFRLLRELDV